MQGGDRQIAAGKVRFRRLFWLRNLDTARSNVEYADPWRSHTGHGRSTLRSHDDAVEIPLVQPQAASDALAVAETAGFGKAAWLCHVSQPALSAQVAQLESALGVVLFERSNTAIRVLPGFRACWSGMRASHDRRRRVATSRGASGGPAVGDPAHRGDSDDFPVPGPAAGGACAQGVSQAASRLDGAAHGGDSTRAERRNDGRCPGRARSRLRHRRSPRCWERTLFCSRRPAVTG